mmetsp:Transcript_14897/g.13466  ORF Transcript_14897/g.13466 Transcript_14897/m.13466 type:complete len:810 (+) Transcript_14897:330-2759(+)|eukprot:CAMPEP_0196763984 /NCGR_PEP_ID=MMETSP1095-20130614/5172_1 /TAXON_ID=96789 ORGANISM="Chromulina nebulosa, Strain UTEXLB2642" /NCGR_SAMPLE_ID=MMETSP1095 /ASSEMBLY_ACC=CAM_ASM_000446 /LENGTH=809 /DNA_ID=CAMNT_0042118431 /DNA_START=100 /DNA_END=2529 /DNA_ORIENTATION=-
MGAEHSHVDYSTINISIPSSLRPVYPFLYDAHRLLRTVKKEPAVAVNKKRLALSCINHGFKLLIVLNIEFDADAKECLQKFNDLRNQLGKELGVALEPLPQYIPTTDKPAFPSHEILLAEADSVLALAEDQMTEGFRFEAMLNYHTACVFYRVLTSMIPALSDIVRKRLMYAAYKTRQSSLLQQNFVLEHFADTSCADVYEVHGSSKLGKGSYGSVYLATHRITGDERAVKVMNVDRVTSYYLRKLHTEIAVLRAVDHPNIIKLQDVFFGRRSVYLVTDLCKGGELFELLNSGKSQGFVFREDRASQLMRDMISAVHYLHGKGIVHRDLKLENFLFETKTVTSPLVLIDFGLSRFYEADERMNQRVGSCYYTAPEVLNGSYDHRCDNWSLGVLCYMLLSGTPPFYGKSVDEVYAATLTQEPVFIEKKFKHVSPGCIDFMKRLLVKDPEKRMNLADALVHPFITGLLAPLSLPSPPPLTFPNVSSSSSLMTTNSHSSGTIGSSEIQLMMGSSTSPSHSSFTFGSLLNSFTHHNNSAKEMTNGSDPTLSLAKRHALPIEVATSIVESLIIFTSSNPLIRLTLTMLSHTLSPDKIQEIRKVFQSIDSTHSGYVSPKELFAALLSNQAVATGTINLEGLLSAAKLTSFRESSPLIPGYNQLYDFSTIGNCSYRSSPALSDPRLTYHDFVAIMVFSRIDILEERVKLVFNTLDPDKSGCITVESMRKFLGEEMSESSLQLIIQSADWDRDGMVMENDFMQTWRNFRRSLGRSDGSPVPPQDSAQSIQPAARTSTKLKLPAHNFGNRFSKPMEEG